MESLQVKIERDGEVYRFEVEDYVHHTGDRCKFEVYLNGEIAASFEPDPQEHLYVCKNPGKLDAELLHLLADEIEAYDWFWSENK
ncbi:MAG TPA: hypothetical protein VHS53_13925 [Mucilaginibacter sp.]|jgi:hypothetical protein|nr:hypothetical protein [Mucilaginibacter sp.]